MRRVFALLGCLAFANACTDLGVGVRSLTELERAANRWERRGPDSYVYEIQRLCFCLEEETRPVRIRVEDDAVVERTYVETGEAVPAFLAQAFPAVEGLFELVRDAYREDADHVEVSYDRELGYPTVISIDRDEHAVDEELSVWVTEPPVPIPGS